MAINKQDRNAALIYGHGAYKAIPKSVFAQLAWYFAERAADDFGGSTAPLIAIRDEARILHENGLITDGQLRGLERTLGAHLRERGQ